MTSKDWDAIIEADRRAEAWLESRTLAERIAFLIEIGIYDANGELSASYGGPGEHTREDPDAPIPTAPAP
jgi:hypothetical protein